MKQNRWSYAKSGVDIHKKSRAVKNLIKTLKYRRTNTFKPVTKVGHYAGGVSFGEYILMLSTDGVGTKIFIAVEMKKYDTIGIDCIAMNVNDLLCTGAEPVAFVDYLAVAQPNVTRERAIAKGLNVGAKLANVNIVGGELAVMPDIITEFDLSGTALGVVHSKRVITGSKIRAGDIILGLKSSGIHSNGLTLARKLIQANNLNYHDYEPEINARPGDELLKPTKIYVKPLLELLDTVEVKGLAHITGGGLRNLIRLNSHVQFRINKPFEPQKIFLFLKKLGSLTTEELYQTFNMGMGFVIILSKKDVHDAINILEKQEEIQIVGEIVKGKGVNVPPLDLQYFEY